MLKRAALLVLTLLIAIVVFTFVAQNTGTVEIIFAGFPISHSIAITFIAAFVFGAIFGMLCMSSYALRLINERRMLRRSLRMSESEVSSLRQLPISDAD